MSAFSELYNRIPEQLVDGLTRVVREVPQLLHENPSGIGGIPDVDPTFQYEVIVAPDVLPGTGLICARREGETIIFERVQLALHNVVSQAELMHTDEQVAKFAGYHNVPVDTAAAALLERTAGIVAVNDCIHRFDGEALQPPVVMDIVSIAIDRALS